MNKAFFTETGSSLIEVMVALLVLGVGLLGVVSLQTKSLDSGQRALFITEAQLLVQDMADRIMAFGSGSQGNNTGDYGGTDTGDTDNPPQADLSCRASGCTTQQTIQNDQSEWATYLNDSSLPRARGLVTWAEAQFIYKIEVRWDQERTGDVNVDCDEVSISCYQVELRLP